MAKDTKRDRVWAALLRLDADPPTYKLTHMYGGDELHGFAKPDIRAAVEGEVGSRTVHDVVQTALEYGLLEKIKDPPWASVKEHPETGRQVQMEIYRLSRADEDAGTTGGERVENVRNRSPDTDPGDTSPGDDTAPAAVATTPPERSLRDRVDALDLEGSGQTLEARREALLAVIKHLREAGSASVEELKELIDDEDARLYQDANSFWRNMSRQGVFADLEVVEKPGKGGKLYHYAEPSA